jgi:hypothetical protein
MVSSDSQKQMLRAGSLLGPNPVDRTKISATPKQMANPFAALMGDDDDDEVPLTRTTRMKDHSAVAHG